MAWHEPIKGEYREELKRELWKDYTSGSGISQRELAELHGVSQWTVSHLLAEFRKEHQETVDEAKVLDLGRLETLIDMWFQRALKQPGNKDPSKMVRDLIKTKARIYGYEAPARLRIEGEITHTVEPELAAILERVKKQNDEIGQQLKALPAPEDIVEAEIVREEEDPR